MAQRYVYMSKKKKSEQKQQGNMLKIKIPKAGYNVVTEIKFKCNSDTHELVKRCTLYL